MAQDGPDAGAPQTETATQSPGPPRLACGAEENAHSSATTT